MSATRHTSIRFRALLRDREVRGLLLAQATSDIGDSFTRIAVATLVLLRADSALLYALTFAVAFVPPLFGSALLTPFADRLSRKSVMVVCDLARAAVIAVLATMAWLEAPLPVFFVLLVVSELFAVPFKAARQAMLPDVLPEQQRFLAVQGLSQTLHQSAQVFGLVVGGAVATAVGPTTALALDTGTFLLSWLLIVTHVVRRSAALPGRFDVSTLLSDVRVSVSEILSHPVRRAFVPFAWGITFVLVAPEAVALVYAREHGRTGFGAVLLACVPAGAAIGAVLVARCQPRRALALMRPAALVATVPLLLTGLDPGPVAVLGLWAVAGLAQGFCVPTIFMTVTLVTPPELRGRVVGFASSVFSMLTVAAYLANGALADLWTPALAVATTGAFGLFVVAGLIATWPDTALDRVTRLPKG